MEIKSKRGFETWVGGGLGSMPFAAYILEPFTPTLELLATTEAVIRIFDRYGERRDRNRARIKFVIAKWGIEKFREVFVAEKNVVRATTSGWFESFKLTYPEEKVSDTISANKLLKDPKTPGFEQWEKTNVIKQKQKGFNAIYVRCYLGDLTPQQSREVAQISRDLGIGEVRTTITQNILIKSVPDRAVESVYARLSKLELALPYAQQIADITRCPGADTCNLAVTHSKGLARDITEKVFANGYASDPDLKDVTIKISGCTNACGHHHVADIGFYGGARNYEGKPIPHYQLLLGGGTGSRVEDTGFGKRVAQIPARRIHEAVKRLLDLYKSDHENSETFREWTLRKEIPYFKTEMMPFQSIEPLKKDKNYAEDLGDEGNDFKIKVGPGECAA